jgi:hypothetical protein
MDDNALEELYFATVLELADEKGNTWRITPTALDGDDASRILAPHTDAYILTAENPESSGEFTAEENAAATASLAHELDHSVATVRACPGHALDSDHVEPGFAVMAHAENSVAMRQLTIDLARSYRQNAIFHLSQKGLGIIGVLRPELQAFRAVRITRLAH